MMRILLFSSLFFIIGTLHTYAQEVLTGIAVNSPVRDNYLQASLLKSSPDGMIELPFFDDFSGRKIYPDSRKWSDRYAFINNNYPVNPVSIGVATLDAIDHTGSLYEHATTWPFVADRLTSRPVNLNFQASDSIYLSFYYQPQGTGDNPQPRDSLRLEFYSPEEEAWLSVWSVPGDSLRDFRLVMIPVTDPRYLTEGFRFRFSNIASLADNRFNPGSIGNADHWNIDYVYLNRERSFSDTVFRDITFIEPLESLLNNYHSMPWSHFQTGRITEMNSEISITYRNNDNVTRSVRREFSIFNVYENRTVHSFSEGIINIGPGTVRLDNPLMAYSFNTTIQDSALFRIRAWLVTDDFDFKGNDTVTFYQKFNNYFALDDGTAENGYGLFGGGTENARLAYRFRAYRPDTLRAIQIYFNQSMNDASIQYFNLAVWDDNNGRPGDLIYTQEGEKPVYEDELNKFHTYHLDSAIHISQVFYVGLIQTTSEFLNIGFDVNRNNRDKIFYNIYGDWMNSAFDGSLMIRPVVGAPIRTKALPGEDNRKDLNIYPNPVSNTLHISPEPGIEPGSVTYKLFNRVGQIVYQGSGNISTIDVSSLPTGVYFLKPESSSAVFKTRKILVTR
jgi:hypothetical protein